MRFPVLPVTLPPDEGTRHIFIAVHGIGDQQRNATVRAVGNRVAGSDHISPGAGVRPLAPQPLGYFHRHYSFYGPAKDVPASVTLDKESLLKGLFARSQFTEVFWADIPEDVRRKGDTLEETKAWARTVAARAERLYRTAATKGVLKGNDVTVKPDFALASEVLEEIVDTVHVLENLTYLADKAGIFSFDLDEVLDAYVGDVQLVTEFRDIRLNILGAFHQTMERVYGEELKKHLDAHMGSGPPPPMNVRFHIVSHSEGTVVGFLGLLYALAGYRVFNNDPGRSEPDEDKGPHVRPARQGELGWLDCVSSFMTIGSPIDKHLLLWDHLWTPFHGLEERGVDAAGNVTNHGWDPAIAQHQIKWRNYYDYGDPVGFKLDSARAWLDTVNCKAFQFVDDPKDPDGSHDIGFSRYLFPGKAHNDYWDDDGVFDHFLVRTVLQEKPRRPDIWKWQQTLREACSKLKMTTAKPSAAAEHTRAAEPSVPTRDPLRPRDKNGVFFWSTFVPYMISFLILLTGCFIIYKNASEAVHPESDLLQRYVRFTLLGTEPKHGSSGWDLGLNVLGSTLLVAGTTLFARLLRLMRSRLRWVCAIGSFAVGCFGYLALTSPYSRYEIGGSALSRLEKEDKDGGQGWDAKPSGGAANSPCALRIVGGWAWQRILPRHGGAGRHEEFAVMLSHCCGALKPIPADMLVMFIALVVAALGCLSGPEAGAGAQRRHDWFFQRGMRPMLVIGVIFVSVLIFTQMFPKPPPKLEKLGLGELSARLLETIQQHSEHLDDSQVVQDKLEVERAVANKIIDPERLETKLNESKDIVAALHEFADSARLVTPRGKMWPVLLALAAFFYLWWLAALLFELTFVWHYYIRRNKTNDALLRWKGALWEMEKGGARSAASAGG